MSLRFRQVAVYVMSTVFVLLVLTEAMGAPLTIEQYNQDKVDIERYWALGYLDTPPATRFPVGRKELLHHLDRAEQHGGMDPFSAYLTHLYRMEWDRNYSVDGTSRTYRYFHPLLNLLGDKKGRLYSTDLDLLNVRDPENDLEYGANFVQRLELIQDKSFRNTAFMLYGWGLETWLNVQGRYEAFVRFMDTSEKGAGYHFDVYNGYAGYVSHQQDHKAITFDETIAYISYQGKLFRFRAGRGKHAWGPGLFQRLVFGEQYLAYPYIEGEFNWQDKLLLTYFHGQLDASPEVPDDTLYFSPEGNARWAGPQKYVAAHRLELMPKSWLALGFTEAIYYGERNPELGYFIPVNLFWSEGHNQDYDDNAMWSIDARLRLHKGLLLYGEFFIDEMNFGALFTDEFGNRTGYNVGTRWLLPFGLDRIDLRVEYTRIRPFVYTHWFDINLPTHYGERLGSDLQPNSDELHARLRWNPYDDLTLDGYAFMRRHGTTPEGEEPVGGSYLESRFRNTGIYPFLAGKREDHNEYGMRISWRMLEQLELFMLGATGEQIGEEYTKVIGGLYYRY